MPALESKPPATATPGLTATWELLRLAAPMIGITLSRMMINLIDFWMVSRLGTEAQAAITPSTMLLFTIACTGMGIAQGLQTFVSQADGRGEPQRAGAYLWNALYIAVFAAIAGAPVALYAGQWFPWFAELARHEPGVRELEVQFLVFGLWSIGPMTACAGLESFYNGIKRPIFGLISILVSLATLIVVNYALIYGHWGFPALGIAGSGVGTLASWLAKLAVLLIPLFFVKSLDERYHMRRSLRLDFTKLRDLLRVGWPLAFQWLLDIGAWFVFLELIVPPYGAAEMAASNIVVQFMHLSFMPALGIGLALSTQVGNAVGAGRHEEAVLRLRVARRLILGYMGAMSLVFVLAPEPIIALFNGTGAVLALAKVSLIWAAIFQLSDGICITYSFALRGAGDMHRPAFYFAVCCWAIFVAGGLSAVWLMPQFGIDGPWMTCALYIVVLGTLLWRRFHGGAWRSIRLFDRDAAQPTAGEAGKQTTETSDVAESVPMIV